VQAVPHDALPPDPFADDPDDPARAILDAVLSIRTRKEHP